MKRKKIRIRLFLPVLAAFLALYLVLMGIATFLVKENFMKDFEGMYDSMFSRIEGSLQRAVDENSRSAEELSDSWEKDFCSDSAMNALVGLYAEESRYFQCSCALFDGEKDVLAKNKNFLTFIPAMHAPAEQADSKAVQQNTEDAWEEIGEFSFPADDYLDEEEIRGLAYWVYEHLTHYPGRDGRDEGDQNETASAGDASLQYRITLALHKETKEPAQILVQQMDWGKGSRSEAAEKSAGTSAPGHSGSEGILWFPDRVWDHSSVVWMWTKPDLSLLEETPEHFWELEALVYTAFPYLSSGYEHWLSWQENDFLQGLQLDKELFYTMPLYNAKVDGDPPFLARTKRVIPVGVPATGQEWERCFFVAAADCHPWLAAMDHMKYSYLLGFGCMLVCTCVLCFCIGWVSRRRDVLEENRRDFTNAVAHELKTPLCVIRGFAENLKEHTVEEKREYYLDQIIQKTEEMDALAEEMICVSRLDSDAPVLKMESVCLNDLVETQVKKLGDVIRSKDLRLTYHQEEKFCLDGDRRYLEKAVWNLLSNAAAYNVENGVILISVSSSSLCIENTGPHISEKDLPHIYEMFYSGEDASSCGERHLGIGLCLTKKICFLHRLSLAVQNTETGVRAEVKM